MHRGSKLRRREDGKIFEVTFLGHWSDIEAEDEEEDTVKWYGDGYTSATKGFSYELVIPNDIGDEK